MLFSLIVNKEKEAIEIFWQRRTVRVIKETQMKIEGDRQKDREEKEQKNIIQEDRLNSKKKKRGKATYILAMLGCFVVLILVMYLGTGLYVWIEDGIRKNTDAAAEAAGIVDKTYSQEELDAQLAAAVEAAKEEAATAANEEAQRILGGIEESLSAGNSVVETLRPYYPEDIVVVSNGTFHFVPIRDDLKKNQLVQENLTILESGELQYHQDGQLVSHKGIDVSEHQGEIDWQLVAQDGVEFAFIRVGFRGYGSTGKLVEDEQFENNITGALQNGIKVGVYFFSQAINEEEIQEEANFVLEKIAPYKVEFPVVFDVEKVADKSGRMNLITVEERTNLTLSFLQKIEQAGYTPMIYHNMEMGTVLIDIAQFENYEKWFAYYSQEFYYPYDYQVWQYSEKGSVNGIQGNVDLNISFKVWGQE